MNFALKSLAVALLVVSVHFTAVAFVQAVETPAPSASSPEVAASDTLIQTKAPDDWIVFDDTTYTPVVDTVSQHLNEVRKAFDAKDNKKAAREMRAVADELKKQAVRVGDEENAQKKAAKKLEAADTKMALDTIKRLNASAEKVSSAAAAIESGKIKTSDELNKALDPATRADIEQRWLVTDVITWYPVSEEPQHHFTAAVAAYAKKDYKTAATEIRKATGYLRLEAGRATGDAKKELNASIAQLDTLVDSVEKGVSKEELAMAKVFAKASHALAVEHQAQAAKSWARNNYNNAGYELKAAAHGLESAGAWVAGDAKAGVSATVTGTRILGDKLTSGLTWTRDEVAKGFEKLGNSLVELGHKIDANHR
ncbi:MAG: hypothetical protein PHZ02_16365 [Desulfocapsaceae bacterium]|nr:hypothetical protein [Desulfocapsaceae bacterium]